MKQFSFILLIMFLVFQLAHANPCPEGNKYAQAPDGCSSWGNNPQQVRDSWGPVNFRPACNEHDKCYYTLGTSEASCNDALNKRLLTACRDGLRKCFNTPFGRKCTPPEPASYTACAAIAESMYLAVRGASRWVYREAQDKQRKHEQKCAAEANKVAMAATGAYFAFRGATYFGFYNPGNANPSGAGDLIARCGFRAPGAYQMHRVGIGGDNVGLLKDAQFSPLADRGLCPIPTGYFAWGSATHYSNGDGTYCSFPTQQGHWDHTARRPHERSFGNLESDPNGFMRFTGACGN